MLIDEWMPEYDFVERHRTSVQAPVGTVFPLISAVDLGAHPLARLLLALRAIPALLARGATTMARRTGLSLRDASRYGFVMLAEEPDREIVLGLTGRFWRPSGDVRPTDPATFRETVPPGTARVAWNFAVAASPSGTILSTETRIRCADATARRSFGRYWWIVQPGSGLIRRMMLGMIKREAEAVAQRRG